MSTESRLRALHEFALPDDTFDMEGPSLSINIETNYAPNNRDSQAFETRWAEEGQILGEIGDLLQKGESFVSMVYTYRAIGTIALTLLTPPGKPANTDAKLAETVMEVIEPEMLRLLAFFEYHKSAITSFVSYIAGFKAKRPSDEMCWKLCQFLDLLATLDQLKNMKTSMTNDFSFFKRQKTKSREKSDGFDLVVVQDLQTFLAKKNSIMSQLHQDIQKLCEQSDQKSKSSKDATDTIQDILVHFANMASEWVEKDQYATPKEKYFLLRAIPYWLYLADDGARPVGKVKNIKTSVYIKLFKKFPVVPLYGDMWGDLGQILKQAPTCKDDATWDFTVSDSKSQSEYLIINHITNIRNEYNTFLALWNSTCKEVKLQLRSNGGPLGSISETLALELRSVILMGFNHLTDWSGRVLSQSAWKSLHMNQDPNLNVTVDYERAVRYNYDSSEKFALIEAIAMLKSLASIMLKEDALFGPILRSSIHDEMQKFIQSDMRDMLRNLAKNKDKFRQSYSEITELRVLGADWKDGNPPNDGALRGDKPSVNESLPMIPKRAVPPSKTQLELFRSIIYGLLTEPRKKLGMFGDKDFSDQHIKELETIYERSFWYQHLLDYGNTIRTITDLGDLWYREYFLELTSFTEKKIQFEIDMSLAWSLCDHVLDSGNLSMFDSILYPLDIYNDAANRALRHLKQQFLYDEIEAEVNLAFDQLIYKLSDQCFTHYKTVAACLLLDKDLKTNLESLYPDRSLRFSPPKSRLTTLFAQRHFQLLGRSIDLNELLSQRMNNAIRDNFAKILAKFEASPITAIIEYEQLHNVLKLSHQLLVQDGLSLDPWHSIFNEVNNSSSLGSFHGRLVLHVVFEIVYDLCPNFVFFAATNRFTRAPPLGRSEEVVLRENMPKLQPKQLYGNKLLSLAFQQYCELYNHFFGTPHIESIYRCIGKESMHLIISELLSNMSLKLTNVLDPYVQEVSRGLPANKINLPKYQYGVVGAFEYFRAKLIDIQNYPVLVTEVFHQFREWGNAIILLTFLDAGASTMDSSVYVLASPFLGITPHKSTKQSNGSSEGGDGTKRPVLPEPTPLMSTLKTINGILEKKPEIAKSTMALPVLLSAALDAQRAYTLPSQRYTLLRASLQGLADMLAPMGTPWGINAGATDNKLLPVDQTYEFYRVWSALLFVFLIDVPDNEASGFNKTSFELFGEGFLWAGTAIVHFLGQRARFEVFDFAHQIARMAEVLSYDERPTIPQANGPAQTNWTHLFLQQRFPEARDIIKRVFHILETNFPVEFSPSVNSLAPPATDAAIGKKFVAPAQI